MGEWFGRFLPALFMSAAIFGVLCLTATVLLPDGRRLSRTVYWSLALMAIVTGCATALGH